MEESSAAPHALDEAQVERVSTLSRDWLDATRRRWNAMDKIGWDFFDQYFESQQPPPPWGGFKRADFPEITTGAQAMELVNALDSSLEFSEGLRRNVLQQKIQKGILRVVMEAEPDLAVKVTPRFHFDRLTKNYGGAFPQDLVAPARKLWRDALARYVVLHEERKFARDVLLLGAKEAGVEFPSLEGEDVFPELASFDRKLADNRETYLKELERLFRQFHVLKDS
ncbi:MAG: hypothetical protein ACE5H3_03615 [Planctomycetota bacterium]